jgi:transposase
VGAPAQYGPRVRAIGAYLVGYQHLPYERACETLADLLGAAMSVGTLVSVVTRTSDGLVPFLDAVREQIAAAPVAHFDETSLRVAATGAWLHAASTESFITVLRARIPRTRRDRRRWGASRVRRYRRGYTPYRRYGLAHALCNAHHLRELAGILDVDPDQSWADQMIRLLCEINDTARYARTAGAHAIDKRLLAVYRHRYNEIINAGAAVNPSPAGHGARSPVANLLARLGGFATDVLRFAHDLRVPFDNSLAERDIRMVKLRQKISGGLRTWAGAETFCAIRSYLSTARKQGINALDALTRLHNGRAWLPGTS